MCGCVCVLGGGGVRRRRDILHTGLLICLYNELGVFVVVVLLKKTSNKTPLTKYIQYNTIQYNTIQYNTIQYNTIQYNTITLFQH